MEYFRMRAILADAEQESGLNELNFVSREILVEIGLAANNGRLTHVTDLTRSEKYGTLPTVVKRIADLVNSGWIVRQDNPEDRRAKILSLSPKSETAFRRLSRTIRKFNKAN